MSHKPSAFVAPEYTHCQTGAAFGSNDTSMLPLIVRVIAAAVGPVGFATLPVALIVHVPVVLEVDVYQDDQVAVPPRYETGPPQRSGAGVAAGQPGVCHAVSTAF